jgi:hypothetical protein
MKTRTVSPTMGMAPFSDEEDCLVVIHSPFLEPQNSGIVRMKRLLAHELVHVLAATQTRIYQDLGRQKPKHARIGLTKRGVG